MTEPTANEADVAEQQQSAVPEDGATGSGAPGALPDEAEVADVLEQYADVPGSDDDYPSAAGRAEEQS